MLMAPTFWDVDIDGTLSRYPRRCIDIWDKTSAYHIDGTIITHHIDGTIMG
jgi:hypothetical protein